MLGEGFSQLSRICQYTATLKMMFLLSQWVSLQTLLFSSQIPYHNTHNTYLYLFDTLQHIIY